MKAFLNIPYQMFSVLNPGHIYTNTSNDVMFHDEEYDAEEWVYSDRTVYRGLPDPEYTTLNVYSLYDENLNRIGIAEHSKEDPSEFNVFWFYANQFATLLQEPGWTATQKTLWSTLTPEAYQDLLDSDFKDVLLKGASRIVTPTYIMSGFPDLYVCERCNHRSFSSETVCHAMKKVRIEPDVSSILFLDDSFVLYSSPSDSIVLSKLGLQRGDAP
jgi:hypothetical protein